jgi:hypothetical protein
MPTPEERIAEFAPAWLPHRPGIITDPIWMEYAVEQVDPATRTQLSAIRLQTVANVYRAIAEGAASAAKVIAAAESGD